MQTPTRHSVEGTYVLDGHELSEADIMRRAHRARSEAIANSLEGLYRAIGRFTKGLFRRGHERQRILNELNALDDRTLSDLGITRGDIPFVANGSSRLGNTRNDNGAAAA